MAALEPPIKRVIVSNEDRAQPALKSALAALAPTLGLKQTSIALLTQDLTPGVSQDSFGGFWLSGTGCDLAQHVAENIRATRPELFEAAGVAPTGVRDTPERSSRRTTVERRAAATAALARANGDRGPRL